MKNLFLVLFEVLTFVSLNIGSLVYSAEVDECSALGEGVFECARRGYFNAVNVYCKCCKSVGTDDYECVGCYSLSNEEKLALELPGRKKCIPKNILGSSYAEGSDENNLLFAKGNLKKNKNKEDNQKFF